jgi:hypothetical protein
MGGASEPEDVGLEEDSAMLRRLVGRAKGLLGRSPVTSCDGRRTNGLDFSGDREGDSGLVGDSDRSRTVEGERKSASESGRRKGDARGERGELNDNFVGEACVCQSIVQVECYTDTDHGSRDSAEKWRVKCTEYGNKVAV